MGSPIRQVTWAWQLPLPPRLDPTPRTMRGQQRHSLAPQCGQILTRLQRSSRRLNTPSRCTRSSLKLRKRLRSGAAGGEQGRAGGRIVRATGAPSAGKHAGGNQQPCTLNNGATPTPRSPHPTPPPPPPAPAQPSCAHLRKLRRSSSPSMTREQPLQMHCSTCTVDLKYPMWNTGSSSWM